MSTWAKEGAPCVLIRRGHHGYQTMVLVHIMAIDNVGDITLSVPSESFQAGHESPVFDGYHKMRTQGPDIIEHFLVAPGHPIIAEATRQLNIQAAHRRMEKALDAYWTALRTHKTAIDELEDVRAAAVVALREINIELEAAQ